MPRLDLEDHELEPLILRALVRRLVEMKILSTNDVEAILTDAASHVDIYGGHLTKEATGEIVKSELLASFLNSSAD